MNNLLLEIKNSLCLFDCKENWDDEGALPLNEKAYTKAIELLLRLFNNIGEYRCPEINLCKDGTIDISFTKIHNLNELESLFDPNEKKARLLINVTENKISWYGFSDLENGVTKNDREVISNENYSKNLEFFIKNYLK